MNDKKLLRLFLSTLYISAFTFGGGFVIVSMMRKRFVEKYGWIEDDEMLDMIAMAQSTPGAIGVNAGILVGWKVVGLPGMLIAVLGMIIPPVVILSIISIFYSAFASNRWVALMLAGMKAGVAAVLFDVVITLATKIIREKKIFFDILTIAAFAAAFFLDVNVILIIAAAALTGVIWALLRRKKNKGGEK